MWITRGLWTPRGSDGLEPGHPSGKLPELHFESPKLPKLEKKIFSRRSAPIWFKKKKKLSSACKRKCMWGLQRILQTFWPTVFKNQTQHDSYNLGIQSVSFWLMSCLVGVFLCKVDRFVLWLHGFPLIKALVRYWELVLTVLQQGRSEPPGTTVQVFHGQFWQTLDE